MLVNSIQVVWNQSAKTHTSCTNTTWVPHCLPVTSPTLRRVYHSAAQAGGVRRQMPNLTSPSYLDTLSTLLLSSKSSTKCPEIDIWHLLTSIFFNSNTCQYWLILCIRRTVLAGIWRYYLVAKKSYIYITIHFIFRIKVYHAAALSLEFSMTGHTWQTYTENGNEKVRITDNTSHPK